MNGEIGCIGWVEALQNHDPPVCVFFEQENLDTLSQTSGIILFVLAMVAQEESHMKSEAILLSLEWRFSRGRFLTPRLFGYDKIEVPDGFGGKKKILSVNESEARVVRWMYSTLLNGGTPEDIAAVLTEMVIPTGGRCRDGTLNTHWTANGVIAMMRKLRTTDLIRRKRQHPLKTACYKGFCGQGGAFRLMCGAGKRAGMRIGPCTMDTITL